MNYGFKYAPTPKNAWKFGSGKASQRFGAAALMLQGHGWAKFVPPSERQKKRGVETMACTVFGSLSAWETLAKFWGFEFPLNCSERYSSVMAGITPVGGDPHQSCEAIRNFGVLPEERLPFDDSVTSFETFHSPKPMDEFLVAEAQKILKKYEPGHEYIFNGRAVAKQAKLMKALERGPVCVSVDAWNKEGGLYVKRGPDNHWVQLVDYKEGEYWLIRDQYAPFSKKLAWNTDFQSAKLYFLGPARSLLEQLRDKLRELLNLLLWKS